MGQGFGASLAEHANFAVGNAVRKPSARSPGVSQGRNDKSREVGRPTLTQKVKGTINEAEGDMALKILKKPSLGPSVEKDVEGVGVECVQEKLVRLFLGFLRVRLQDFDTFFKNRITNGGDARRGGRRAIGT